MPNPFNASVGSMPPVGGPQGPAPMPPMSPPPSSMPPTGGGDQSKDPLDMAHEQAKSAFDKVDSAHNMIQKTRAELDKLTALGDNVTEEDVLKGMASLISAGADPKALISMMAGDPQTNAPQMPSGGQALAAWVKQQDAMVQQKEAPMQKAHSDAAFDMGTSAMHVLMRNHLDDMRQQAMGKMTPPQPPAPPPNPQGPAPMPPKMPKPPAASPPRIPMQGSQPPQSSPLMGNPPVRGPNALGI